MSDNGNEIPEWAEKEARRRIMEAYNLSYPSGPITSGTNFSNHVVNPLAEMIAKHEQPPADKYEVALNTAMNIIYAMDRSLSDRQNNYVNWINAIERMKRIINES